MRRSTPGQRNTQALDAHQNYNAGDETLRQQQQQHYSPRNATNTPRPTGGIKKMPQQSSQPQQTPTLTFRKENTSSDPIVAPTISLSRSMTNVHAPPARTSPWLHSSTAHQRSCEEEEEKKRLYYSMHPSLDYNYFLELERGELQRPATATTTTTGRQIERLRAGSPNNVPSASSAAQNTTLTRNYNRPTEPPHSRLDNYSAFLPAATSSYDQYPSIPFVPPSTMGPGPAIPSWSPPPLMQSSRMSREYARPRFSQETSSVLYEPPRHNNQFDAQAATNCTRYRGVPGQPFQVPGLTSQQTMPTQWITLQGHMPSAVYAGQQSSNFEEPSSPQPSRCAPPPCSLHMDESVNYSAKNAAHDPCHKGRISMPCESSEEEEQTFAAPPRCRPLDPEISRKLSCDLPLFSIPRGNDFICAKQREQWEALVQDKGCPGAIQLTIDGKTNFNALAFDILFGETRLPDCLPCIEPITLLEAFDMRIDYERCQIRKLEARTYAKEHTDNSGKPPPPSNDLSLIENCFKRKPHTELNKALEMLLKAEKSFNFENPHPELPLMNIELDKTSADIPGLPISVKAFTGTTKPRHS